MIAAHLAGDLTVMDNQMADLLLSIVSDVGEPQEVRSKAAISLGPVLEQTDTEGCDEDFAEAPIDESMFHRIQATLQKIYLDDSGLKQVRRRVIEASVRAPQDWHLDAIRAA